MLSYVEYYGVPEFIQDFVFGPSISNLSDIHDMKIQLHAIMWLTITNVKKVSKRSLIFLIKFNLFADGLTFLFLWI